MSKKSYGFTIVELLIVIVVIGILAAITIVAYRGIQDRANDARRESDVAAIAKAMSLWAVDEANQLVTSGAGAGGTTSGWFSMAGGSATSSGATYTSVSIKQLLSSVSPTIVNAGDPSGDVDYMVSFCTTASSDKRVIYARLKNPPTKTVAEQIAGSGCNHSYITLWPDQYGMNYAVVAGV